MDGVWRKIGIGAAVLALSAVGLALFLSADSDPPPLERVSIPAERESDQAQPTGERERPPDQLELSQRGHPIVWVRRDEEVDLHSSPGGPVLERVGHRTKFHSPTVFAVFEQRGNWAGVPAAKAGNGRLAWIELDPDRLGSGFTLREIRVDLSEFQAQLFIDGELARTFTVAIGAPGTETPTGRFAVTDTFRGGLNSAYGCCAVALTAIQPNLDSGWIGGNLIAFHGTSGALGVPISHGCVRAADRDVSALVDEVPPGAPVEIRQ